LYDLPHQLLKDLFPVHK